MNQHSDHTSGPPSECLAPDALSHGETPKCNPPRDLTVFFRTCMVIAIICLATFGLAGILLFQDAIDNSLFDVINLVWLIFGAALAFAAVGAAFRTRRIEFVTNVAFIVIPLGTLVLIVVNLDESYRRPLWHDLAAMVGCILYIGGLALAHTCLFASLETHSPIMNAARRGMIVWGWLTAITYIGVMMVPLLSPGMMYGGEIIFIAASLLTFLTITGTIVVPLVIVARAGRSRASGESLDDQLTLAFTCPVCAHDIAAPTGHTRCTHCRARLFIDIEEPRCECGYVLYNLTGPTCPECGRSITLNGTRAALHPPSIRQ